jgi:group II intron reverse transcriptase/maturase
MALAQKFIETVHKVGEKGGELERVYRRMQDRDLFLNAYGKLYANKGAMTKGIDPNDTVQGMSVARVDRIIEKLRNKTYQWQPARRRNIPKKKGKTRPIGIPPWSEKLVQEVIRTVLEAYYEPQFSEYSHGFRPERGCHTALWEIGKWHGTKWFIEGDIKGCFDNIDHDILLEIISKKIKDYNLLKLLNEMLKAGYMQDWKYHNTYSGTPQGGVLSPLLANIVLNELDKFVENELMPAYNKGEAKKLNPEHNRLRQATHYAKKKGDVERYKSLKKEMRQIPSVVDNDPDFRRLKYCRYADDFILGFIGPKSEAMEIKQKIAEFLRTIKLTMSEEKTLITNAVEDRARFLGYEIRTAIDNTRLAKQQQSGTKRRSINGQIMLILLNFKVDSYVRSVLHLSQPMLLINFLLLCLVIAKVEL